MIHPGLRAFAVVGMVAGMALLSGCATWWSGDFERLTDESDRDFRREVDVDWKDVDFADVIANPSSYKLMSIRFWAILDRKDARVFVTFYSLHRPEDWYSFSLWPLGSRLWDVDDRVRSIPTVYIHKRMNRDVQKVLDAPRYSLMEIRGIVTGDFENLPFVQVVYADVLEGGPAYDDASLDHMLAGMHDARENRPSPAIDHIEAALKGTLAPAARALAHMQLATLYEQRGDLGNALRNYAGARENDPASTAAREGWERVSKEMERRRMIEQERPKDPGEAPK